MMDLRSFPREHENSFLGEYLEAPPHDDDEAGDFRSGWEFYDSRGGAQFYDFTVIAQPRPRGLQRSNVEVYAKFTELRDEWLAATIVLSSTQQMTLHPAYQQIIGLGPQVVPFMIDELRSGPQHYYWALAAIVGTDHGAGADTMQGAAQRWVDWYDERR